MDKPGETQQQSPLAPPEPENSELLRIGLSKLLAAHQNPTITEHQNWLSHLTPEELKIYDDIGFRFQLLRSLLANAHLIALPNQTNAPFSWEEFMKMMDEIREEAECFIGREIERPRSHLFKKFASFYHLLCDLEKTASSHESSDTDLNTRFLGTLEQMPRIIDFETIYFQLNLDQDEAIILKDVLRKLKQLYLTAKNAKENKDSGITVENIHEVTSGLQKLECLRRVGPAGQKGPLDEFKNLINYINIWKRSFKDISGIVNDKTAEVFHTMANTISESFPDAIMPATYRHHRDVIGRRIQKYKKLSEILNRVEDPNLQVLTKKIVFQIGIILSYLDFLWNMHDSIKEHGGKRIIYPKSMLMIAPLISNETGKLIKNLQSVADSQKQVSPTPSVDDGDDMLDLFAIHDESQPEISIAGLDEFGPTPRLPSIRPGIEAFRGVVSEEINTLLLTSLPTDPKPLPEDLYKSICPTLETMVTYLTQQLKEANKALRLTSVKSIKDSGVAQGASPQIEYESLSPDIQTFLNSLQESLLLALVEIARIFEPDVNKNDVIPEFIDYENQAAELRLHLYNLGTVVESVGKNLDGQTLEAVGKKPDEAVIKTKIELMKMMEAIGQFQGRQNSCMEQSKYHATLKGQDYEMVNGFITTISNYFLNGGIEQIDKHILGEYLSIREFDELAKACQVTIAQGNVQKHESINVWLMIWSELKRIENDLDRAVLNNQDTKELEEKYSKVFRSLVELAWTIARDSDESEGGGNFKEFAQKNPTIFSRNYRFEPGLFKFTSLMKQFSDFRSIFGMKSQIGNAPLLAEHDRRIKRTIYDTLDLIVSTAAFNGFSQKDQDAVLVHIKQCRRDAEHLRFITPELVEELNETLKYLESYINFGQKHEHKIHRKDLEDIFTRFRKIQDSLKN